MMPPTTAVLRIPIVPSIQTSVRALKRLTFIPMVRLKAFRSEFFTLHGQLLERSGLDVNASYCELAQIYLLRSERHEPMYFGSPPFGADPPPGFRSAIGKSPSPASVSRIRSSRGEESRSRDGAAICWRCAGTAGIRRSRSHGEIEKNHADRSRCSCRRFLQSDQDRQSYMWPTSDIFTIASVVKNALSTAPILMYQHSRSGVSRPGR